jgi:hypothetical protein
MRTRNLIDHMAVGLLLITVMVTTSATRVGAQTRGPANVQETDDKVKVDLYTKFVDTYKTDRAIAHHTAKDYLRLYAKDNDQYSKYVQQWVDIYEKEERQKTLWKLVHTDRNFTEAFPVGKVVMAEEPDQLDSLIALGSAGYLAASARNTTFDKEAIAYAKRAVQLIEAGKKPDDWAPYKGKDDTLAYLYATIGLLQLKPAPNEAIEPLIKSTQLDSELKKLPSTYFYLAQAYQSGPYARLSADFQAKFGGKPETPESKQALEKLNLVIDVMIDAYARAVALAGSDAQYAQNKAAWLNALTPFWKFRHQDSDAGLTEFIASVVSKPLPAKP